MRLIIAAAAIALMLLSAPALAAGLPTRLGQCANSTVTSVETRLTDGSKPVADSGSAISFANNGYQVSYDQIAAVDTSRIGDPVRLCLVSIPQGCPRGDDRGREYKTTNLRTHRSWTLPDSQHSCGGA
jgi:hypothetical protein